MKIKTSELIGPALDYMVHVANGNSMASCSYWLEKYEDEQRRALCEDYSTNWSQGGPIIEREDLSVGRELLDGPCTAFGKGGVRGEGPTPPYRRHALLRRLEAGRRGGYSGGTGMTGTTTVEELRAHVVDLYCDIGHYFVRNYDPEIYDSTMKDLVEELYKAKNRIQEMSK